MSPGDSTVVTDAASTHEIYVCGVIGKMVISTVTLEVTS